MVSGGGPERRRPGRHALDSRSARPGGGPPRAGRPAAVPRDLAVPGGRDPEAGSAPLRHGRPRRGAMVSDERAAARAGPLAGRAVARRPDPRRAARQPALLDDTDLPGAGAVNGRPVDLRKVYSSKVYSSIERP